MHVKGPARRKCLRGVPQPVVTVIPGLGVTAGKQTQKLLPRVLGACAHLARNGLISIQSLAVPHWGLPVWETDI